jgi:predicted RNA binding protein YcfA (HicA-like mRNA interferase family)
LKINTIKKGVFVMCVKRKIVVKVLNENGFVLVPRKGKSKGSHSKYQRTNDDGTTTSYSLVVRKILERGIINDISSLTKIPIEEFYRSGGSKKHQNGIGTFGLFGSNSIQQ